MFRTDKTKRFYIPTGIFILLMLFMVGGLSAQSTYMACNNQVNVSLNENCSVTITPDMILEGEDNYAPPFNDLSNYTITVATNTGSGISGLELTIPGIYVVTITETISGYNNNCWGTLLVEDKLPPQFVDDPSTTINEACPCPVGNNNPDCTLKATCSDLDGYINGQHDDVLVPAYTDCSTTYLGYYDNVIDQGPCYPTRIQREYVVTDASGNKATSCTMEYTVEPIDLDNDIVDPVTPLDLPCNVGYSMSEIFDYYYQIRLEELLSYADEHTPEEILEAEHSAEYYANHYAYPTLYGHKLSSTICNLAVTKSDLVVPACEQCPDIHKIIRTWTYLDWCSGEQATFQQFIKNGGSGGPTLTAVDFTATVDPWSCYGAFYMPEPYHLHDSCSDDVYYDVSGPYGSTINYEADQGFYVTGVPKGVHTFYYNAYDCCGNVNVFPVTVTIVDATPPVAVANEYIVVSLTTGLNGGGVAKLFAESVDNGSHDGCGPVKLEIRREDQHCGIVGDTTYNNDFHTFDDELDPDDGAYVKFCCSDLAYNGVDVDGDGISDYSQYKVWLRVWDDGDMDGYYGSAGDHYNESWSYVRLENKVAPILVCPPDITVDCDTDIYDLSQVGRADGQSACGDSDVDYIDEFEDMSNCGHGTILRRWFVVSNPYAFCIQRIYRLAPYYHDINIVFPQDTIIDCTADLEELIPYWTAPSCNLLAYSVNSDTFYFEEGACQKIRNEWTVIDWCTYEPNNDYSDAGIWEHTQIVKVIDEMAPTLASCDATLMFEANDYADSDGDGITCENNALMLTKVADDQGDCGSQKLRWTVQVDLYSDWTFEHIFSSSNAPNDPYHLPYTSSGEEIKVTLPSGVAGSMANHRVVWKVTDGCGNVSTCTEYFMVVDKKDPTPYCINVSTALMDDGEIELWACDFDLGSFDNCTENADLRFTFSDVNPANDPSYNPTSRCSSMTFDCDDVTDAGQSPVEVQVYVWDEKDNVDFCTVYLTLIDNNANCEGTIGGNTDVRLGGYVVTESGEELTQISVELMSSNPEFPKFETTDNDGAYAFADVPMYQAYELSGYKNDDTNNGVSTLDLVLIQKHILDIKNLDSPYKLIAADANNDAKISAIDLLQIRKLILGIQSEFPNNTSWRFPIKDQYMVADNPWPFKETINIESLNQELMQNDFVGVKIGDVNKSANYGFTNNAEADSRSLNKIDLYYEDVVANIETVTIPVKLRKDVSLSGMQFTLNHAGIKLLRIEGGSLEVSNDHFATLENGNTTFSWNRAKAMDLSEGEVLFSLVFDGDTVDNLAIGDNLLTAEAYVGDDLTIFDVNLAQMQDGQLNQLFQNSPNPFNTSTNIGFNLAEAGQVSLKLIDVSGKIVKVFQTTGQAGFNQLTVDSKELNGSGVWYYQLESANYTAIRKMIIVK